MEFLPGYISIIFILTTLVTIWFFYMAAHSSSVVLVVLLAWIIIQGFVASTGYYTHTDSVPPRFVLNVWPALLAIILLFVFPDGRRFIDKLDLQWLTLLHTVRVPVELVLYWLFLNGAVPQLMTFEGRNPDILCGLSAPFVAYYFFVKKKWGVKTAIAWNIVCLVLLFNIVINAILSAPFPFQQFAFDQPNIAVLYFPFSWLPCCIVPLVLFSHLATLRQLFREHSAKVYSNA